MLGSGVDAGVGSAAGDGSAAGVELPAGVEASAGVGSGAGELVTEDSGLGGVDPSANAEPWLESTIRPASARLSALPPLLVTRRAKLPP